MKLTPATEGWIEWSGEQFAEPGLLIDYKLASGGIFTNPSGDDCWPAAADPGEIVAYRPAGRAAITPEPDNADR